MATVSIAILGMGRIGASIGLALKRYNEKKDAQHRFEIVCADMRGGIREEAQKVGVAEKIDRDLFRAAQNKDLVVLALPYADVLSAYKSIGAELRAGAVVLDVSPLKQPSLEWAAKYLPKEVHMVGISPILNPAYLFDGLDDTLHAKADLFDNGNMLLMPTATCIKDAVELAADFSTLLGATPHFFDPVEHDSLMALIEGLPALLGVASFYATSKSPGWHDAQRLTNPAFGRLTRSLYDTHPDDLRDTWLNNRENLVRRLDDLLLSLKSFRDTLARNDQAALEAALVETSDTYSQWVNRRHNARWDDESKDESQGLTLGNMVMGGLMGNFLSKRFQGGKNGGEK
ncbi:MAG: prephenate dehydrogenase/arogenate dehydrogenase family protein [Anaerolineae bacterium]|nr:prephenate dehydrogenase/arogenate dehydrogenase family protein [Anaerolineae bacterium]